jgi:UDP-GlcNAc:undecaprenyl-phosphate GlcNAc-1-phosphate transferase
VKTLSEFFADTWRAFAGLGLALVITWALTPVVAELARRMGALDAPSARKIHSEPTPRLGGIAIYFGVIIPSLLFLSPEGTMRGILVGASLITLVGVLDDVRGTKPLLKLGLQFAVAGILVLYGVQLETITLPGVGTLVLGWVSVPFSLIWVVAIMNIVNFIDGMDGLAAGVCAISSLTFAVIAISLGRMDIGVLAAITAGATTGFLWHNFYPASIFMGDSGSMLLGFLLAAITLQGFLKGVAAVALVIPLLVLGIPIIDTGFAILRRIKNRQPIYVADRGHLHHRFANLGYSQRQTVVILYSWSALMSVVALCMRFAPVWLTAVAAAVAVVVSALLAYELEILRWRKLTGRWPVPGPGERSEPAGERPSGPEETS